jgi:hypothetical protein
VFSISIETGVPVVTSRAVILEHDAGEHLDQIRLAPLGDEARLSRFALVHPVLQRFFGEPQIRAGSRQQHSPAPARGFRPRW